ncbi:uncharacterized protein L201_006705 [Kwoniella dendrophila CBS 6074]|uniref:F-box domain-containing protein n=1 Tax=Kwoniella dendrophila CBS 6074 TaxID=1295534 RepID=A0AAX4K3U4_9TREE
MKISLLALSDETIKEISYWVNHDNHVPIPSFNPHWANFPMSINSSKNQDQLHLRATCRRIRQLCPLKNLTLVIRDWRKTRKWIFNLEGTKDPITISILKAVRRLVIDCDSKESLASLSTIPMPIITTTNAYVKSVWIALTQFLSICTGLEELFILKTPLCVHGQLDSEPRKLRMPIFDFLPQLKSIAFEMQCKECSNYLPRMFIPAAPKIAHLKTTKGFKIFTSMPRLAKLWSRRHKKEKFPLKTLYVSVYGEGKPEQELYDFSRSCPVLEDLSITSYDRICVRAPIRSTISFITARLIIQEDTQWYYTWTSDSPRNRPLFPKTVDEWKNDTSFMLRNAMLGAAQIIMENIPSVKQLALWHTNCVYEEDSMKLWSRYTFYRQKQKSSEKENTNEDDVEKLVIVIDPFIETFTDEWMANTDGKTHPNPGPAYDWEEVDSEDEIIFDDD